MKIEDLEKFESVKLYSVREIQLVIERDSPAPSLDFTLAERRSVYDFFPSQTEAQTYIQSLRKQDISENPTLQLITSGPRFEKEGSWLDGSVDHGYAHVFEINHSVACQTLPLSELPKDIEALLNNPERRVTKNTRNSPERYFPPSPVFREPESNIVLF